MQKAQLSAPRVAGLVVIVLGAIFVVHWMFGIDAIARLVPGSLSVGLVNPLLFLAIGVCFFGCTQPPAARGGTAWDWATRICIVALVALPMAHLAESAAGVSLGIDLARPDAQPSPLNPHPGRLSPNASVAFMLAGLAFALLRRPLAGARRRLYTGVTIVIAVVGLAGLAGHLLGLETLYKIANFNRLLPTTAFGLAATSAGLWALLEQSSPFDVAEAEQRIENRSLAVIALVALGCGIAGFAIMRDTFEQSVSQNLRLTATTSAASLAHALESSLWYPRTLATRPGVQQAMAKLNAQPAGDDAASSQFLRDTATMPGGELLRAEFHDASGTLRLSVGAAAARRQGALVHPLVHGGETAWVAWNDGYLLVSEHAIVNGGQRVGRVLTEQRLPLFDRLLEQVRAANATSDAAICGRDGELATCAPTRFRPARVVMPLDDAHGTTALAIGRALRGETGVLLARDPRGAEVLAAYAPIQDFGLGLGVTTDVATLYAPLRERVAFLALALVAMVALAIYAQRSQVRPVLRRLAESERRIKSILEEQSELVSLARPDGELTYVNPAYARHFGRTPAQMVGTSLFDEVEPADLELVRSAAAAVLESGQPRTVENRSAPREGGQRWVSWTLSLQRTRTGKPLLRSVGRDVTERNAAERALRDLATVFDNTTDYVVQTDARGRIHYMNPAVRRALGLPPDAPVHGFDFGQFNTPETNRLFAETILPAARAEGVWIGETTVYVADRRMVNVNQMVIAHKGPDGRVSLYSSIMRDITDQLAVQREQQRQAATLRAVAEAIPAIVAVVGKDGRYRFVNSAFERWSGMDRASIVGHPLAEVVGPVEHARSHAWIERALAGETVSFENEYSERSAIRHLAFNYIPLRLEGDEVDGFVAVGLDITRHKQENVRLLQLSQRDPLTGLLNRSGFEAYLEQQGSTRSLALLYIDLDRFKQVNDTHGHAVGDQLLQQFAQRLQGLVRPTDAVARLGGDEFAIALAGMRDGAHADAIAENVVAAARPRFEVADLQLEIGASVGVALGADAAEGWRELIARADRMLYQAKEAGRGRHASVAQRARR